MEKFKIELFNQEHPSQKFPWFRHLSSNEHIAIVDNISSLLHIPRTATSLDLVMKISEAGIVLSDFNAEQTNFKLSSVLKSQNVIPKDKVFVNWYRFDNIDELYFDDLNKYFDNIWYPGPDDIDIFDESFLWILSVSHNGVVSMIQSRRK